MNNDFKYIVDEFADIRVIRYIVPGFDKLSLRQKMYIYYLNEACKCGLDIIWIQKNKDNLLIRKTLENIIKTYSGSKNTNSYKNFLIFAKKVFFSKGLFHHYNHDKFNPNFTIRYFLKLLNNSDVNQFPVEHNQTFIQFKDKIINIIFSQQINKGDLLQQTYTNFYDSVTENEAKEYYENIDNDGENIDYGLNSRLIKKDGQLIEEVYCENGLYGKAIKKIISFLKKAMDYCENDEQKEYTKTLIEYYKTGNLSIWNKYNIEWVQAKQGIIDYVNGFIEIYNDPIGIKASWEGIAELVDDEGTKITDIIADNALWFEQNSPTDEKFKKKKIEGVSAKVVNVTTIGGDSYPDSPIGINLPNSRWIREKYGSKSVSISNLVKAIDNASIESPKNTFGEFRYDKKDIEKKKKLNIIGDEVHVHLHECLGHASGIILPGVKSNSLKEYYSDIEEARADLFALYFMKDQKLVELGILPNLDVADVFYESYIVGGLQVQLARLQLGQEIKEAHMRARKLISEMAYKMGNGEVISKLKEDNKTYFVINDPEKLRNIFGVLLKEIQRIVSEGDYKKAKELIEKYAIKIDYDLHKETLERYKQLNLKPYTGWINPNYKLIKKDEQVIDIEIDYNDDFLTQQLDYGDNYSFL